MALLAFVFLAFYSMPGTLEGRSHAQKNEDIDEFLTPPPKQEPKSQRTKEPRYPTSDASIEEDKNIVRAQSRLFHYIYQQASPAVVYIQATQDPSSAPHQEGMPFGFSSPDEFFRHFFGAPGATPHQEPAIGQGSGFILTSDGYVLTNSHLVRESNEITVILETGREYDAELIGSDPRTDLAVLKIEGTGLPHLDLSESRSLDIGDTVLAIGNPFGLKNTLTNGIVSATRRDPEEVQATKLSDFIQTNVAINPGNSGGPLLNVDGEVVGITSVIFSKSGGSHGIGFAIPSHIIARVTEQLKETGSVAQGYLGIALQKIDHDLAGLLDLEKVHGVLVTEVIPDSPAAEAGIEPEDVIIAYNGHPINSVGALQTDIGLTPPGKTITLTIIRKGKKMEKTATVEAHPSTGPETSALLRRLGFEVTTMTSELAEKHDLPDIKGVVVTHVDWNSPAAKSNLAPGSIIEAVGNETIETSEELLQALQKALNEKEELVRLKVRQGKMIRHVPLRITERGSKKGNL